MIITRWDYGYQISQVANRTLADENTWNHEHIALLGKILVSPVDDSHAILRHLADYVLVWSTRFVGMVVTISPRICVYDSYTLANQMVRFFKVMRVSKDSKRYCAENRGYKPWLIGKSL